MYRAIIILIGCVLFVTQTESQASERPVVAVFDAQAKGIKFKQDTLERLSDYLATLLTARGYQVIPRAELKKRLTLQKHKTFRKCHDQSCQIEVGKELAAQKSLTVKIIRLGRRCMVTLTLYDLARSASEQGATAEKGCQEDDIVDSLKEAVTSLVKDQSSSPKNDYDQIKQRMQYIENYKKRLAEAWKTGSSKAIGKKPRQWLTTPKEHSMIASKR